MKISTKNKIFGFGTLGVVTTAVVTPLAIALSNTNGTSLFHQGRRTLLQYMEKSSASNNGRKWDMSVQSFNMITRDYMDATIPSLFRERVTQNSKVVVNENGVPSEVKKKVSKMKFDAISKVEVDGSSNSFTDFDSLKSRLDSTPTKTFTFHVKPGVKYVDHNGKETKYNFKAIDLFYGYLRNIYTSSDVRINGSIAGKNNAYKMEQEYIDRIKNDSHFSINGRPRREFENGNAYLLNLFGVDLKATIDANTNGANGQNYEPDKFKLIFKTEQDSNIIYNYFSSISVFFPVSSERILELNGDTKVFSDKPGKFLQILEYGQDESENGVTDLATELSVGRFVWKSINENTDTDGLVLIKNEHSYDEDWNKNNKTLNKIQYLIYDKIDKDIFALERQKSFIQENSESVLSGSVLSKTSLMQDILEQNKYETRSSFKQGLISSVYLNPWFLVATSNDSARLNNNTSKLLFGENTADVLNSTTADDEWMLGRGRQFRTLLNASVNLYGLTKTWKPAENDKVKSDSDYYSGQPLITSINLQEDRKTPGHERTAIPHGIVPIVEQKKHYVESGSDANPESSYMNPSDTQHFNDMKAAWKKFVDDAVADGVPAGGYRFPIYDFRATDKGTETPEDISTYKTLVKQLNRISEGSGITFVEFNAENDKAHNNINKATAPVHYIGSGADYSSIGSIIQQLISAPYGYTVLAQMTAQAMENSNNLKDFSSDQTNFELTEDTDFLKGFVSYLKDPLNGYTESQNLATLKGITLQDWYNFKNNKAFTGREKYKTALAELDDAAQKYFFTVATDATLVRKLANYVANLSIAYKTSIGYASYAALGPSIESSTLPTSKIYTSKWLHLASPAQHSGSKGNLIDTYVDLD